LGETYLKHDSGIVIGMDGWIYAPRLDDEPDSNGELVAAAIDEWVAKAIELPPPPPKETAPPKPPPSDH
jgi:hypothetical protein